MKRKIKIGDRVYIKQYNSIIGIETIIKITPTMTKSSKSNFGREIEDTGWIKIKGQDKWASQTAYIETPELKKEVEERSLRKWITENYTKIPLDEVKRLKEAYKQED